MKRRTDNRWIFFSLFYPTQAWPLLLQKAVIPFLHQVAPGFTNYIIHFGKDRGDHIGLSFEVPAERYKPFVVETDRYFRTYMHQFPARPGNNEEAIHPEKKFMDLPVNTVCHSLHRFFPFIEHDGGRYTNVWRSSSDHLLTIYGDTSFDKEDLFTATLYLNLMLMLSCGNNALLPDAASGRSDAWADEGYTAQFAEQETLFMDIRQDCVNIVQGSVAEELEPIATWFGVFNDYLQTVEVTADKQTQLLKETIIWLRAQLGMVSDGRSFIDYCMYRLWRQ